MNSSVAPTEADEEATMARYGITRVPAHQYHYKMFRYSKLSDAVAQAQREVATRVEPNP